MMTKQMRRRVEVCEEWRRYIKADPNILWRIITADKTWIHYFDSLSKQQSNTWKSSALSFDDFGKTFTKWQDRLRSCLAVQRAYFEKDVQTLNLTDDSE